MRRTILITVVLVVAGCSSTHEFTRTSQVSPPPPRPSDCDVAVFDHFPDEFVYRELGYCETTIPGGVLIANEDTRALREFKRCACEAGGNALVVESGFTSLSRYSTTKNKARASVLIIQE